jgi:hypothetical protein
MTGASLWVTDTGAGLGPGLGTEEGWVAPDSIDFQVDDDRLLE